MRTFVVGCPSFYPRHRHCCTFFFFKALFLFRSIFVFLQDPNNQTILSILHAPVSYENSKDTQLLLLLCVIHMTRDIQHIQQCPVPILQSRDSMFNLLGHKLNVGDRDISYRYTANTVDIASLSWYPSPTISGYSCSWARNTLSQHRRSYVSGMSSAAVLGSATGSTQLDRWHGDRAAQTDPSR